MFKTTLTILMLLAVVPVASATDPVVSKQGPWVIVESDNFHVCAIKPESEVTWLADACESVRKQLTDRWLGEKKTTLWQPKCHVVLHPTAESYLREVGPGQMTAGSSLIELEADRVVKRQIDLREDHKDGYYDALAHEMTHVIVADRFTSRQIPRWADEGMAVLADSLPKQTLHLGDLRRARHQQASFRVAELFSLEDYPGAARQAAFYGQSASVAQFLVNRGTPEQFVRFVEQATNGGYDAALRSCYDIDGVHGLERLWNRHLDSPSGLLVSSDSTRVVWPKN
jgi:hypothetical protein